jgi:hypothetical protein
VDAVHPRLIWELEAIFAVRLEGAVGGVVSVVLDELLQPARQAVPKRTKDTKAVRRASTGDSKNEFTAIAP